MVLNFFCKAIIYQLVIPKKLANKYVAIHPMTTWCDVLLCNPLVLYLYYPSTILHACQGCFKRDVPMYIVYVEGRCCNCEQDSSPPLSAS